MARLRFKSKALRSTVLPAFHAVLALALVPFTAALMVELLRLGPAVAQAGAGSWWPYLAGAGGYVALELVFKKPMWVYVFGHELTHAAAAILCGAKVFSFKASSKGGEVRLSKSNLFIALSPYVVPLYALVGIAAFAVARIWWPEPVLNTGFRVFLGAAVAFHLSMTASAVHRHQTDLHVAGLPLSFVLIMIGNAVMLAALLIALFDATPSVGAFARLTGERALDYYAHVWRGVLWIRSHTR